MNLINEPNRWQPVDPRMSSSTIAATFMNEPTRDDAQHPIAAIILGLLHIVWKRKWLIAPVVAVVIALGLIITLLTTPMYRATALVRIDRNAAQVTSTDSNNAMSNAGAAEFYQTEYGVLRSHEVALKAVDELNLIQNPAFFDKKGLGGRALPPPASASERNARRDQAADILSANLQVTPIALSGLVNVSYSSPSPALAAQIANAVSQAYIDYNSQRRLNGSASAREQLAALTEAAKTRLDDSERQAVEYARAKQIINIAPANSGGSAGGQTASDTAAQSLVAVDLSKLNSDLADAHTNRILLQQRWQQVQNTPPANIPEVQQDAVLQLMQQRLVEAKANYQQDLAQHGDLWPSVIAGKAQVAQIESDVSAQMAALKEGMHQKYLVAQSQESALSGVLAGQKSAYLDTQEKNIEYNILLRDVDTNKTEYQNDLDRYKELGQAANVDVNNVSFIDQALTPGGPYTPNAPRNLVVAAFLGLVLGTLIALGLEQLDETVKVPADIESKLGISLLGSIPTAPKEITPAQAMADPRSAISEAYYSVRTALQFSTPEGAPRSLLVTSARPSEGKSTTAVALAQGFARLGIRTLLIDSDLRNPSLHKVLGLSNAVGLSTLLTGQVDIARTAQQTAFEGLSFVACGPLPPNPAELLGGNQMRQLLEELVGLYDQVIVDGPPVMGLADAPLLAAMTAGTVLVVEAGSTRRSLARSALARLRVGPVRVVGAVLTKFQAKKVGYGYGYGYGAGYGMGHAYSYEYGATPALPEEKKKGVFKRKLPKPR